MRAGLALLLVACAGPAATPSPRSNPPSPALVAETQRERPVATPIAITIDDLPYVGGLVPGDTPERAVQRMLASAEGTPLTGFFTCRGGEARQAAWRAWMRSSIEVANHTQSHRSIDDFSDIAAWRRDVESCQRTLERDAAREVRHFRYPYLRTGENLERRDAGFAVLRELGLTRAPVSVDTSDWALARAYARDRDPEVAAAYVDHVRRSARRYRSLASSMAHHDAPQILLLHANALAADHLGDVLDGLRADGFRFVSLEEALSHPLYAMRDPYIGDVGMSWLYRVGRAQDRWRWDAAQLNAMRVRFEARAETAQLELDAELSVRRVSDRTYVVTHDSPWPANSLVAEMSDGSLLFVDTPYTDGATRSLLDWAAARFGPRDLHAVNTHFHPDALGGNAALIEAGARVYGSEQTARLAEESAESMRDDLAGWLSARPAVAARFRDYAPTPPARTFASAEGLTLDLGEPVHVLHPGHAHSPDNLVVHLPARDVLFGGCAVLAGDGLGNTADADLQRWPSAMQALEALEPRTVIPGHGERTDPGLLTHTRELLERRPSE